MNPIPDLPFPMPTPRRRRRRRVHTRPSPSREFLTARELADCLGLSLSTIRKHSMHPDCPVIRSSFCTRVLFKRDQYLAWYQSAAVDGGAE